jgi:hypothetical protein
MFDNTIVMALRWSRISEFDKLPNYRTRSDATPKWKDGSPYRVRATLVAPSGRWEASRRMAPARDCPVTGSIKYRRKLRRDAPPVDDRRSRASHNLKAVGWSRAQCRTNVMLSAVRKSCRFSLFALQMFFVLCEIVLIYFVATVLFLAIHHYECNGRLATLFKCLVLAVGGVAIIYKLQPVLGLNWF